MNFNLLMSFHRKLISMTSMGDLIHGLVGIPSSTALMFCNLILSELRDQERLLDDLGPALITFILNALQSNQLGIYRSWSALKLTLIPSLSICFQSPPRKSSQIWSLKFYWFYLTRANAIQCCLPSSCSSLWILLFAQLRISVKDCDSPLLSKTLFLSEF